ncbi:hypothetical protein FISHEDRAFT_64702 [Fistulina hepatica ATCC 64428]|uniref:ATP synthase F(0) complex subunit e, mitochondrial n=1 Tax=Fistulina hepatica ATCC 64428 TaxID=1128425 RepID=A0A0D7AJH7_9AGAR|nr:hypothetical protein FISHEDRAFT_64702 [Fistulina hepatica ATCC 64428]
MVSTTVNVVRYTALLSGLVYGWYHNRTLRAAHEQHKFEHAVHHREQLIKQAKEAWAKKQAGTAVRYLVITNPDDPRFDLEKLLTKWEAAV